MRVHIKLQVAIFMINTCGDNSIENDTKRSDDAKIFKIRRDFKINHVEDVIINWL